MSVATRISYQDFVSTAPAAYAGLAALSKAVDESGMDKQLTELVKIRASQINGCAFCLQFHLNLARKIGMPAVKLDLLAAWREAGVYSERELAALEWTEALTDIRQGIPSDQLYQQLQQHFSQSEIMFLSVAIGAINQWNRIGAAFCFAPPPAA